MAEILIDILIAESRAREKYFRNYLRYARIIAREAKKSLGRDARIFIFGSILKKEPARDIDILILSPKPLSPIERRDVVVHIWKRIGISNPFEIHIADPEEYREWYSHFMTKKVEVR